MKTIICLILVVSFIDISFCATSFKDLATNLCLEGNANKGIFSNDCNIRNAFQRWILNPSESTIIAGQIFRDIKNVPSGFCLDGERSSKRVFAAECNNSDSQKWTINSQEVKNAIGLCLESDSDNKVFLNDCLQNTFQQWNNDN